MIHLFRSKLVWLLIAAVAVLGSALFFGSMVSAPFLWSISNGGTLLLPLLVSSAIVDSVNPCAFSILILTIAFLVSIGKLRSGILKIGGAYVFGIFTVYILIGLGILQALHLFNAPHFMAKFGASLLILLGGINIIGEFFPRFPIKLQIPAAAHRSMAQLMEKASVLAAFLLGGLVGLCEFPCTGGPYLMVLGLLHDNATFVSAVLYLLLYNIIFVLPLVILLLLASDGALLSRIQDWQRSKVKNMRFWSGIAMLILGALILFL